MIVTSKEISKKVADNNDIDFNIIDSINSIVFASLRENLNSPDHLAYELPGIGTFELRFKQFEKHFNHFKNLVETNNENAIAAVNRNPEYYKRNKLLIEKIDEFRNDKKEKRILRHGQNNTNETSEDNI